MCPADNHIRVTDAQENILAPDGTMCLKFFDTDQESKIDVGVSWPYEKLERYECIIADDFELLGVEVGDKLTI